MSNLISLFQHIPTPILIGFVLSTVIPLVSALLSKHPGFWTGTCTGLLSALTGFLTEWAAKGDGFDWRAGLAATLASYAIATRVHSKVLAGTDVEQKLHSAGIK